LSLTLFLDKSRMKMLKAVCGGSHYAKTPG